MTSRYLDKPSFVFLDTQDVCIPIIIRHLVDTCCPTNVSYWSKRLSRPFFSTVHVPKSFFAMMFLAQRTSNGTYYTPTSSHLIPSQSYLLRPLSSARLSVRLTWIFILLARSFLFFLFSYPNRHDALCLDICLFPGEKQKNETVWCTCTKRLAERTLWHLPDVRREPTT